MCLLLTNKPEIQSAEGFAWQTPTGSECSEAAGLTPLPSLGFCETARVLPFQAARHYHALHRSGLSLLNNKQSWFLFNNILLFGIRTSPSSLLNVCKPGRFLISVLVWLFCKFVLISHFLFNSFPSMHNRNQNLLFLFVIYSSNSQMKISL